MAASPADSEHTNIDWPELGYATAQRLLGAPNPRLTAEEGPAARWGRRGSFWYSRRSGRWHDFESGQGGDVLDLIARETGLDRRQSFQWLSEQGFLSPAALPAGGSRRLREGNPVRDAILPPEYLQDLWTKALPITAQSWHPARRWLRNRHLWPPGEPLPPGIRWLPRYAAEPATGCCGRLLALLAPWPHWEQAAGTGQPLPEPQALQTIAITKAGLPCRDRPEAAGGLDKRTLGPSRSAIFLAGGELPAPTIRIAEGVADALALAARCDSEDGEAALATAGTGPWHSPEFADTLDRTGSRIILHPDQDAAGRRAALELSRRLADRDATVEIAPAGPPGADPAALAAKDPLQASSAA